MREKSSNIEQDHVTPKSNDVYKCKLPREKEIPKTGPIPKDLHNPGKCCSQITLLNFPRIFCPKLFSRELQKFNFL